MKMHWFFSLVLLSASSLHAKPQERAHKIQDTVALRRIAEYWKEGDIASVKVQIRNFLATHTDGTYSDQLYAMLGDIFFHEKNYADALIAYREIRGKEFQKKCGFNQVHSYFMQGNDADAIAQAKIVLKEGVTDRGQEQILRYEMASSYFRLAQLNDSPLAKEALYRQALIEYKILAQTDYLDQILSPLSEIYAYFKEGEKAAAIYLKLAERFPEKREEFLFHAATWQVGFDENLAIETYGRIYRLGGSFAAEAACNQMNLLFRLKHYRELLIAQDDAFKHIPAEKMPLMHYYVGKSLVAIGSYAPAIVPLKLFTSTPHTDPELLKSALLSLMRCARETHDLALFDQILIHLKHAYPHEEETAQGLIIHAQLCKEKGDFARALEDLCQVAASFPDHPLKEAIAYDSAVLFAQNKQWAQGVQAFRSFIKHYPGSLKKGAAWRQLTLCQIEDTKQSTPLTEKIKQEDLVNVLSGALQQHKIFSQTEMQKVHYLLGKTTYEIGKYEDALETLSMFVLEYPEDPRCAEAHLLMAYCHLKGAQDQLLFTVEAEKTLALQPGHPEQSTLHLQLYNAYLALAQKESHDEKKALVNLAANHLFLAMDHPIKKENLLWLANYYYRSQEKDPQVFTRAVSVLEHLLGVGGEIYRLKVSAGSLEMEAEAIKLSQLYDKAHRYLEKTRLLQALNTIYEHHPDHAWKYPRLCLFELAKAYEQLNKPQRAMQTYEFLIRSASHSTSYFATAAKLNIAKLQFSQIALPECHQDAVHKILDTLKDLEIQRKLVTEPAHLEATLSYIEIKSALYPESERIEKTLHLLKRAREAFTNLDDPLVKDYFSAKNQFSDKLKLFQHYMQYFSAEEHRLDGMLKLAQHETFRAKESKMKALIQLDALSQEPMHELLEKRVRQSREALNQSL